MKLILEFLVVLFLLGALLSALALVRRVWGGFRHWGGWIWEWFQEELFPGNSPISEPRSRDQAPDPSRTAARKDAGKPERGSGKSPYPELFAQANALMGDLGPILEQGAQAGLPKERILRTLQGRIREYPMMKGTPFQVAIDNYLLVTSCELPSLKLTPEDLRPLWRDPDSGSSGLQSYPLEKGRKDA